MAYFKKALDAGEELGVETMAINSGWGYWNEDREEAWKRSREMLSVLAEYAKTKISDWQWNLFVRRNPTLLLRYMM